MAQIRYLPEAMEDLHEIWTYVDGQAKSLEVADRLLDSIDDAAALYADNPLIGTPRFE